MKFGVIVFPGSNCDRDTEHALGTVLGAEVRPIWHSEESLRDVDCVVVPGGFSYGDYLRAGAIARFSPVMRAVARFADDGGLVLGICNGFQVLVEAGLLPGALLRNAALEFRCRWTDLRVERADTPFTNAYASDALIRVPVAHGEGRYYADPATLERLERNRQVVVRYVTPSPPSHPGSPRSGEGFPRSADPAAQPALPQGARGGLEALLPLSRGRERGQGGEGAHNPNGSSHDIAGIVNERGNVFGLMPHPERACEALVGSADGLRLFQSIVRSGARV